MKKVLCICFSILILFQSVALPLRVSAYDPADVTTENIQALIDALPDPDTVTPGQEPCREDVLEIFRMLYSLAGQNQTPPQLHKLYAVADKVLTVSERCWSIVPTGSVSDENANPGNYHTVRDWLKNKNSPELEEFKGELKRTYADLLKLPVSQRPKSNMYTRIRNQFRNLFSAQDMLECMLPDSVEAVEALTAEEIQWYKDEQRRGYDIAPIFIWDQINVDSGLDPKPWAHTLDVTVLVAMSKKILTLQQRAGVLPHLYSWQGIANAGGGDSDRITAIREEVIYLYDRIFGKVPLSEGETMPNLGNHTTDPEYGVPLIASASYTLTYEERYAYLPTPEEYENMSQAQKIMVTNEVNSLLAYAYRQPAASMPDISKILALTPTAMTLENRCLRLPDKTKIAELSPEMQETIRNEVITLYDMIDALTEEDTYPSTAARTRLRATAAELLTLQERIDRLPTVEELDSAGGKYTTFIFEEANTLRTLINALDAGETPPNDEKLVTVEDYFNPVTVYIYNESDLTDLINTMNNSSKPLVRCGIFMESFAASCGYKLQKGTLTLLGNGHELALEVVQYQTYCFGVLGSAILNLGSKTDPSKNEFHLTAASGFGSILLSGDTATLNICDGVTISDACGRSNPAGINITSSGTVNMYGGTLKNLYHDSTADCAGVRVNGNGKFYMYDGLITDCYGYLGGAVSINGDGFFQMAGGTIQNSYSARMGGGAVLLYTAGAGKFLMTGGTIQDCFTGTYTFENPVLGTTKTFTKVNAFGGAVFSYSGTGGTELNGGLITRNEAQIGGGVFVYTGYCKADGVEIIKNNSDVQGGGLAVYTGCSLTMKNSKVCNNEAKSSGGGVFGNKQNNIEISDSVITGNTSEATGGGIYIGASSTFDIQATKVSNNVSSANGGGFYITGAAGEISGDCVINENSAKYGAGIYKTGTGNLAISDTEIGKNQVTSSTVYGAGMYAGGGTVELDNVDIYENSAPQIGGGISIASATVTLNSGSIHENTAQRGGGVAITGTGKLIVNGGKITENEATSVGGGIYAGASGCSVEMNGGEVTANLSSGASGAGGMYIGSVATSLTITGGKIAGNAAYAYGGGIVTFTDTVIGDNAKLYDNRAVTEGDDLIFSSSTKTLSLGTCCNETITGCHQVDNWYEDAAGQRWFCYTVPGTSPNTVVNAGTYTGEVYLKAAHGTKEAYSFHATGRRLEQLTGTEEGTVVAQNGATTAFFNFEQTAENWYLGSNQLLPAGTKLTLIYYPDGTNLSAQYYQLKLSSATYGLSLQDFTIMGGTAKFARTDTRDYFTCQVAMVFPDDNTLDDTTYIWLTDAEDPEYFSNGTAYQVQFDGNDVAKPVANLVLTSEDGGEDSLTATAKVSGLAGLVRSASDPERYSGALLTDYKPSLVLELLDKNGKQVAFPKSSTVKIGETEISTPDGIAVYSISADGEYDIEISDVHKGGYKLRVSVRATTDNVTAKPMMYCAKKVTSDVLSVLPTKQYITAEGAEGYAGLVVKKSEIGDSGKELSYDVSYLPAESTDDISVKVYKKTDGAYSTECSWAYTVTDKSYGSAKVKVTVPKDVTVSGAGTTYRIVFKIGNASYSYNIIITD